MTKTLSADLRTWRNKIPE